MGGRDWDWPRIFVLAVLATLLLTRLKICTEKLLEWRIGSVEVSVDADEILLPSITFCPKSVGHKGKKSKNITADYIALPHLKDMLERFDQRVNGKNG